MPSSIQKNQAKFQHALLKIAYKKAAAEATTGRGNVGFDIRGRAIYDLNLNEFDLEKILTFLGYTQIPQDFDNRVRVLKSLVGIDFTFPIRCNLDLNSEVTDPQIRANIEELNTNENNERLGDTNKKMSIIPLYEELLANIEHNDAAVRKRLQKLLDNPLPPIVDNALTQAFTRAKNNIQEEVNAVAKTIQQNSSIREINQQLDKARSNLHKSLKMTWFGVFKSQIENMELIQKRIIYSALKDRQFKEIYKETPAHQYDILGIDFNNGTTSYITNSGDRTAHNKHAWVFGASALRFMVRNGLSMAGQVTARPGGEISARVPSVASVEADDTLQDVRRDVDGIVEIFQQFHVKFDAFYESKEEKASESNQAIVYNLLTSLDPYFEEQRDKKNFQNESARRILEGSHRYNQRVFKDVQNPANGKYIWVQNLSVNRHSNSLNEFFASPLEKEVKLMADIALLYTLQHNLNLLSLSSPYNDVLSQYQQFLNTSPKPQYFHKSKQGQNASKLIQQFKKHLSMEETISRNSSLVFKANMALLKIYKHNYHYDKNYGSLIQALSIFVEKKSVAGCKSANERHEDVQKRTGFLIGCEGQNNALPTELNEALNRFLKEPKMKPEELDKVLAQVVNDKRMNGDENSISHSDQAGPSKLQIIAKSFARGIWNLGKTVLGLGVLSSVGTGAAIIALTILGVVFPPLDLALAIGAGVLGLGIVASFVPKLWPVAQLCLGLGTVSSLGMGIGMGVMGILGFGCPPLGLALSISVGVIGLGILASSTGAFVFKAKNTNFACSSEMTNNINTNASKLQSSHGMKIIMEAAEKELVSLSSSKPPLTKSAKNLSKLGTPQGSKKVQFNPLVSYAPADLSRGSRKVVDVDGPNEKKATAPGL